MAYTKTIWLPRLGTNLNKFTKSAETPASVILTNTPDAVTQAGTPFSAEYMNKIEQGISDAHEMLAAMQAGEAFGYLMEFQFEPTSLEMALWRALPLQGQMINFVSYPEYRRLCDRKYVGDAANATADWWYKTSDPAGTVRDVNGAYMRVLDHRGLFSRAAGQNSKYRMASDTPYDGKSIGQWIGDAIRNIKGRIQAERSEQYNRYEGALYPTAWANINNVAPTETIYNHAITFDASRVVPVALENRPASISSFLCIKY
jgi:hypothetical protein